MPGGRGSGRGRGGRKAQVFSFYPNASYESVVTVVDTDGTIEINDTNGKRTVKIKDPSGKEVYSGPLNTPAATMPSPGSSGTRSRMRKARSRSPTLTTRRKSP